MSFSGDPMVRHFYLILLLLVCSSAAAEADPKSRIESRPVGEAWHDSDGILRVFLQKNAGAGAIPGWRLAESKGCGFRVELFGPYNELKQESKTTDGAMVTVVVIGNHTPEGVKFSASCYRRSDDTFKPGLIAGIFDGLSASAEVAERRMVDRGEYEAESLKLRRADRSAEFEMFKLGSMLFQLVVEYPESEADSAPAMAEHFFASFHPRRQGLRNSGTESSIRP
jgi:hypothetical protein